MGHYLDDRITELSLKNLWLRVKRNKTLQSRKPNTNIAKFIKLMLGIFWGKTVKEQNKRVSELKGKEKVRKIFPVIFLLLMQWMFAECYCPFSFKTSFHILSATETEPCSAAQWQFTIQ